MTKRLRNWLAVIGIITLMLTAVALKPSVTTAANLTAGNYTYLINGDEVTFTFDPVIKKDGVLLPFEVFRQFDINVDGSQDRVVTLSRDEVTAKLTVGSTTMLVNGQPKSVSTAPLRLNGRVFVPSDVLQQFGIEFGQDGNYITMRSYVGAMADPKTYDSAEWSSMKGQRGVRDSSIKADSNFNMIADFVLLNEKLINATNLNLPYGVRARLLSMLSTNTLVHVTMSNYYTKAGSFVTAGVALVDDQRHQYDVASIMDIGDGLLSSKLVPGATRTGVLVFPKVPETISTLSLYYDANGSSLGSFPVIK